MLRCRVGGVPAGYPREGQSHPNAGSRRRQGPDESLSRNEEERGPAFERLQQARPEKPGPTFPKVTRGQDREGCVENVLASGWLGS